MKWQLWFVYPFNRYLLDIHSVEGTVDSKSKRPNSCFEGLESYWKAASYKLKRVALIHWYLDQQSKYISVQPFILDEFFLCICFSKNLVKIRNQRLAALEWLGCLCSNRFHSKGFVIIIDNNVFSQNWDNHFKVNKIICTYDWYTDLTHNEVWLLSLLCLLLLWNNNHNTLLYEVNIILGVPIYGFHFVWMLEYSKNGFEYLVCIFLKFEFVLNFVRKVLIWKFYHVTLQTLCLWKIIHAFSNVNSKIFRKF